MVVLSSLTIASTLATTATAAVVATSRATPAVPVLPLGRQLQHCSHRGSKLTRSINTLSLPIITVAFLRIFIREKPVWSTYWVRPNISIKQLTPICCIVRYAVRYWHLLNQQHILHQLLRLIVAIVRYKSLYIPLVTPLESFCSKDIVRTHTHTASVAIPGPL